jgi:hypothetical protein
MGSINNLITIDQWTGSTPSPLSKLTEGNRKYSDNEVISASDVNLDSGLTRRYIKKNKKSFSLSWTYLPEKPEHTIDGMYARNYVKTLANSVNKLYLTIKDSPDSDTQSFLVYPVSYSETLIKRDIAIDCSYYDVTFVCEEV